MNDEHHFLDAILADPGDEGPRLAYADWLEARADPRGPYLRAEAERADEGTLRGLAGGLDPVWVARVSRPPIGTCCDRVRFEDLPGWAGQPDGVASPFARRPRLDPATLDRVEGRLGVDLPPEYRAFLLNTNGGAPRPGHFRVPGRDPADPAFRRNRVEWFLNVWSPDGEPVDYDNDLVQRAIDYLFEFREIFPTWVQGPCSDMVPIAIGGLTGEWELLALGVRGDSRGRVYFVNHFLDPEDPEKALPLAPSLPAFLAMLGEAPAG